MQPRYKQDGRRVIIAMKSPPTKTAKSRRIPPTRSPCARPAARVSIDVRTTAPKLIDANLQGDRQSLATAVWFIGTIRSRLQRNQ